MINLIENKIVLGLHHNLIVAAFDEFALMRCSVQVKVSNGYT